MVATVLLFGEQKPETQKDSILNHDHDYNDLNFKQLGWNAPIMSTSVTIECNKGAILANSQSIARSILVLFLGVGEIDDKKILSTSSVP